MVNKLLRFFKDKRAVLLLLLIVIAGILKFQSEKYHRWDEKERLDRTIIRSDGAGYYAYLPQHFIYQDPHYFFIDSVASNYPNGKMGEFGNFASPESGRMNKFFPGVAICQLPFFLSAHWFHSSKYKSDGYSYPYQRAIALGAICFLLLGLFLSYLVMIRMKIAPLAAALSLVGISLGTPLLFYTINEPLASHVYSFTAIALFIYLLIEWKESKNFKWLAWIGLTLGLIVLLRPVNGIVVLLYFVCFPSLKASWNFMKENLFSSFSQITIPLVCFAGVILIQYFNVYYQTGNFDFNLYSTETFSNWNNPPIFDVLFGFRKGLFVYAPLCLLAFFGVLFTFKKHKSQTILALLFFLIFTYITAAWWCWWYGGSLGMRPMVDISALYAIGLAIILHKANYLFKIVSLLFIAFSIIFQLTLSHQFENGILHFSEMNKKRYEYIFLKRDKRFQWMFYIEPLPAFENNSKLKTTESWDNENYEIEHMIGDQIHAIAIDSNIISKYKGLRITGKIIIRDRNNIPLIQIQGKKQKTWEIFQTDFVGMRIPNVHEFSEFASDYIFTENISEFDSLGVYFINSHGKTNIENFKIQLVEK